MLIIPCLLHCLIMSVGLFSFHENIIKMPSTLSIRIIYLSYWLTVKCRNVRQTLFAVMIIRADILPANVPASNIREIDYHTVFGSSAESTSSYKPYEELFFPVNYTAVIGFNDLQSYSAMEILQKKGYRIPEDISLISFDHLRKTHTYLPPLTSIADNSEKSIADTAVSILLDKIRNPSSEISSEVLPVSIFDDHTTGPINETFAHSFE